MTPAPADPCDRYRTLTEEEIATLTRQGCSAEDWTRILVHQDFTAGRVTDTRFSGDIRMGRFSDDIPLRGGMTQPSGIYRTRLHHVTVGDNCLLSDIPGGIAHYDIGDGCVITRCDTIVTEGETCFGQGTEITVLSETGGREIIIHDRLSAQEAYMQAMYRHDSLLTARLKEMAGRYADERRASRGHIGKGCRLTRCGLLRNVWIGAHCHIEGAGCLEEGTIRSCAEAPVHIGEAVIARRFILQEGCHIGDGAMLTRCHVGQATVIGHGYSASDSYFACNCQAENGEACAIFAGPYTVTHHKSTLLIGGMFSFMNAGSGTNQSNHMYKLGPSHHGILERGCKTASGAHILWPARIGAFSMIMGRCAAHADTSLLPFSYLIERHGQPALLIPGIALRNVGTLRDIRKWPSRDGRPQDCPHTDPVSFDAFSPYTMGRMLQGRALLQDLLRQMPDEAEGTLWQGLYLKRSAMGKGLELYRLALQRHFGKALAERLTQGLDIEPDAPDHGEWTDMGGLLMPRREADRLTGRIKDGSIATVEALAEACARIHKDYKEDAWAWTWEQMQRFYDDRKATVCHKALTGWAEAVSRLNEAIIEDASKEFAGASCVGFGIDGDADTAAKDFAAVRGRMEDNPLIQQLRAESRTVEARARELIATLD